MTDAKTDVLPFEEYDTALPERRNLALALFGALGGAALLEACTADASQVPQETLGHVVQAASGAGTLKFADTVSELRTITTGAAGWVAVLNGYSAKGDGGGGVFFWDTTAAVDDGGIFFNNATPPSTAAGWRRIYSGAINVRWFGAVGTGNVTTAFTNALAAGSYVVVPSGSFTIAGVGSGGIPADTTLELLPGAVISTSSAIIMKSSRGRLLGHRRGENGTTPISNPSIICTATNVVVLDIYPASSMVDLTGIAVEGIWISTSQSGVTGIRLANGVTSHVAWALFRDVMIYGTSTGVDFAGLASMTRFQNLHVDGPYTAGSNFLQYGIYLRSNSDTVFFDNFVVQNYSSYGIWITGQCSTIVFRNGVVESQTGGMSQPGTTAVAAIAIDAGYGDYLVDSCHLEGLSSVNQIGVRLGTSTSTVGGVNILGNYFNGFGSAIKGVQWTSFLAEGNQIAGGSSQYAFNNGGGTTRFAGRWINNKLLTPSSGFTEMNDTAGIELVLKEQADTSGKPNPVLQFAGRSEAVRWGATLGTALASTDFASSGWGAGSYIDSVSGTDARGSFRMNSNAIGSANPTITLTFKDGTWTNAPFAMVAHSGGSNHQTIPVNWTTTATTLTITLLETPPAAVNYVFTFMVMG